MTASQKKWKRIFDSAGDDFRLFECRCLQNYAKAKDRVALYLKYNGWEHLKERNTKVAAVFDAPTWREEMAGHLVAGETGQALAVLFALIRDKTANAIYPRMCETLIVNACCLQNDKTICNDIRRAQHICYFGDVAWSNRVDVKGCAVTCCRHLSLRSLNGIKLPPQTESFYLVPERIDRLARIICENDVSTMEKFKRKLKDDNAKVDGGSWCHS